VSLVDASPQHDWLLKAIDKRLREELATLQVAINEEKSRIVDLVQGEQFSFLGFDFRRVRSRQGVWRAWYPPSTTVVVMNLYVVCSANIWRSLDASGAIRTRPEYAQRAAVWRARDPRRGAEFRRHSAAHQPARGLEGCQTARHGALRHFF